VQQLTMLVTPDAQWVLPDSPEFFEALGDPEPDYDSISYAVTNLGFIKFQVVEHSIIEVELHPQNVELPALLAVQQKSSGPRCGCFGSSSTTRIGVLKSHRPASM
jgi:hypothetical protein